MNYVGIRGNLTDSFKGQIKDVRIYNRALSSAEIKQLYIKELNQ